MTPGGPGSPLQAPPRRDADVAAWLAALGVPGIVDVHTHFMPERLLARVWAYFDRAQEHYGVRWPLRYRMPEPQRLAVLRSLGVRAFAPLVYPHKPGMATSQSHRVVASTTATRSRGDARPARNVSTLSATVSTCSRGNST